MNAELEAFMEANGIPEEERKALRESWVGQTTGEINRLKDSHSGTQPVRVLHDMVLHMFNNTYPTG